MAFFVQEPHSTSRELNPALPGATLMCVLHENKGTGGRSSPAPHWKERTPTQGLSGPSGVPDCSQVKGGSESGAEWGNMPERS